MEGFEGPKQQSPEDEVRTQKEKKEKSKNEKK